MKMDWDHDIIKEFISIEDKSRFLVFESVQIQEDLIFATYRMSKLTISKGRFSRNSVVIPLSSYLSRIREKKINEIINVI